MAAPRGGRVCIRKVRDAFEDEIDAKQLLRELTLLRHFAACEHICSLRDVARPPRGPLSSWRHLYLVEDPCDTDLTYVIHSKQPLTDDHVRYFLFQLLHALKAMHAAHVMHAWICPKNLGVDRDCTLKILPGTFGFHCVADPDGVVRWTSVPDFNLTGDAYSENDRAYAAPEQLLENAELSTAVDLWAAGTILAELLGRAKLLPGRDYLQQIRLIVEFLGPPSAEDLATVSNPQAAEYIRALPPKPQAVGIAQRFPYAQSDALDLISRLLVFQPTRRLTAAEALEHRYFDTLREAHSNEHTMEEATAATLPPPAEDELWATDDGRREYLYRLVKEYHALIWPTAMMEQMEAERHEEP